MKKTYLSVLLLVFVLLIAATAGVTYAKYIRSFEHKGKVTVTADLVETFALYESYADQQDNGSYSLVDTSTVESNSYVLLPGLDVPKDPKIEIKGKTNIAAYLYVEVVQSENFDEKNITYSLTDDWKPLGIEGREIYYYKTVLDESFPNGTISILKNDTVYVSQNLPRNTNVKLDFYAYMAQAVGDNPDPAETFKSNFQ